MSTETAEQDKRLKNIKLAIEMQAPIQYKFEKKGFQVIFDFYSKESNFWSHVKSNPLRERFARPFNEIIDRLTHFKDSQYDNNDEAFNISWQKVNDEIQRISRDKFLLYSDSPMAQFCATLDTTESQGVLVYLARLNSSSTQEPTWNSKISYGFLMAHEFLKRDSAIVRVEEAEQNTISQVIANAVNNFNNTQVVLNDRMSQVENLHNQIEQKYNDLITNKIPQHKKAIAESVNSFEGQKNNWLESAIKSQTELEKKYGELMRLKMPMQYWNDRAGKLDTSKEYWFKVLILSTLCMILLLVLLLYYPPNIFGRSLATGDALAIKGVVLFIAILSFGIFFIRIVSKLFMSSSHLKEDAEERRDLTHVYLALISDSEVDEKVKSIVYQALFGRVDTGLLKGEGSPSLPFGELMDKIKK